MTQPPDLPKVTLVVAMFNEGSAIEACLGSIAMQDYDADLLEVLVYDGGSTDRSVEIAESIADGRPRWSVRANPRRIQAAAWNLGIEAATGDLVGIVSAHSTLGPAYVRSAVAAIRETGADMVGGPVRALGEGVIGEAVAIAMSTPFGVGGARHHYLTQRAEVDTVFMGICRRATYVRFPFDETMVRNQDDELSYRLLDAGGRIVCDPAIQSTYTNRATLGSLWRQFYAYGWWKVAVVAKHPRQARLRHFVPTGLVGALLIGTTAGIRSTRSRWLTAVLAGTYAVATVGASLRFRDRAQPSSVLALAVVYPTMHLAYGSGMIAGTLRSALSRRGGVPAVPGSDGVDPLDSTSTAHGPKTMERR